MVVHGDYRLNPENGALPQKIAGAAIVAGGGRFPEVADLGTLEGQSWRHSDSWELGFQALYLVGNDAARVLLLTDMNSNVPVVLERGRERAIAAGDNSGRLRLLFLAPAAQPQIGDRIVTSGHGGVFPPGIPVGAVVGFRDGVALVQPFVEAARLEYVRLVDYGLGGILPQPAPPPARSRGR